MPKRRLPTEVDLRALPSMAPPAMQMGRLPQQRVMLCKRCDLYVDFGFPGMRCCNPEHRAYHTQVWTEELN